ncbi:hypothetical protein DFH29DRAFT_1005243 [Suillus ampliporus]|nr:hypothetical protein DFH29DRAFT_1005243 [Suillus ampliporus]
MPIHPKIDQNQDILEAPSKSSSSDRDTINQPLPFSSFFPPLPSQFALRPAIFNPLMPTLPTITATPIPVQPTLPATTVPLIPKPQFIYQPTTLPIQTAAPPNPKPTQPPQNPPASTTTMSTTSKGILAMPGPGSNKAPTFNGKMLELIEFFELFEDLASSCALTNEQKCKAIVCYMDVLTKQYWVTLTGYESKNYGTFKNSILAKYPHVNQGTHCLLT